MTSRTLVWARGWRSSADKARPRGAAPLDLARLELKILVEETLNRFPNMTIDGEPTWVVSQFSSQLKSLPVRLEG
jgi:hypothetical protein